MRKTIGIVVVAALAAAGGVVFATMHCDPATNQIGRKRRQAIILTLRPAIFDRHVSALNGSRLAQALAEWAARRCANGPATTPLRKPITGIAACWARAASGQPPPRRPEA